MKRILVNAVSAKDGGARSIVESFVESVGSSPDVEFIIFAGFKREAHSSANIKWCFLPLSGLFAVVFNLFGVIFPFLRYRCETLLSFNNMNCLLVPSVSKITYFHQSKALDPSIVEIKARLIRIYLNVSRERVVVQSSQVRIAFVEMFGAVRHQVIVAWPGINVPAIKVGVVREPNHILVPVVSPQSPHKNFCFIAEVARLLGPSWVISVTAQDGLVDATGLDNINFIGPQKQSALFELYCRSTLVLMASTHETIGLPIFEALASGTPVVAYDATYIRAFLMDYGIKSGLNLVSTPQEARKAILDFSNSSCEIKYDFDFAKGDWAKVLNEL